MKDKTHNCVHKQTMWVKCPRRYMAIDVLGCYCLCLDSPSNKCKVRPLAQVTKG